MSWRIEVTHRSTYRYGRRVTGSYNEVRMTPQSADGQRVLDHRLTVAPLSPVMRFRDYWGTHVDVFDVHVPHTELDITMTSVVETSPPKARRAQASWTDLQSSSLCDAMAEFLAPTSFTAVDQIGREVAYSLRGKSTPDVVARALGEWTHEEMRYQPGTTQVSTPATEALTNRTGVCQDFAHVTIALARSLGIPARYVSGYLHPSPDTDLGELVWGQSHAWVELWTGEWRAFDPTNGATVGERHIVVGRGRDYGDVSPLRGIYQGGGGAALDVEVTLTRVG